MTHGVPSGYSSNRQRLLRRLRIGFLIALLPLLALATWLYWLTLPEYEPTGNEVYDAFAPIAYEQAMKNLAYGRLRSLEHLKISKNSRDSKTAALISKGIAYFIPVTRFSERFFKRYDSTYSDNVDYVNFKAIETGIYGRADLIQESIDNGVFNEGTYWLLFRSSLSEEDYAAMRKEAIALYPNYSCFRFRDAEASLGLACDSIESIIRGRNEPSKSDIAVQLDAAKGHMEDCLNASINKAPEFVPFSMAKYELRNSPAQINRRIAGYYADEYAIYEYYIYANRYKVLLSAYEYGYIGIGLLDYYLKYLYKWMIFEDSLAGSRKMFVVGDYCDYYIGLKDNVLGLTASQDGELKRFLDKMDAIETTCRNSRRSAKPRSVANDEEWLKYRLTLMDNSDCIVREMSALTPPTIEGWLAGGAKLKPRQNAGATQP